MITTFRVRAVMRREWQSFFNSPVAYVFLVVFLVLNAFLTFSVSRLYEAGQADLLGSFIWHPWLFLILVPAVAMRLWSEERRSGTIEFLLTLPLTPTEAILGKFFAAWFFLILSLGLTAPVVLTVFFLGTPDPGPIWTGYLGSSLLAGAYLAIGLFTSALTKNQVVSFVLSVAIGLFLNLAGFPPVTDLLSNIAPAWAVGCVASLGFIPHFDTFQKGIVDVGDGLYFVTLMVATLWATALVLNQKARRGRGGIQWILGMILLTALSSGVSKLGLRADFTGDRLNTLSEDARRLIEALPRKVSLKLFASQGDGIPIPFKSYAKRVEDLLGEMVRVSRGKLNLERIAVRPDSQEEEWAQKFGLSGRPISSLEGSPMLILGVVALSGQREAVIPFLMPQTEPQLEYQAARIISTVGTDLRGRVGVLSALPVGAEDPLAEPAGFQPSWVLMDELQKFCMVEKVNPDLPIIPSDLDALVLIHPQNLSDALLFEIDQYVLKGGRLIAFVDPMNLTQMQVHRDQTLETLSMAASNLNRLTAAWGATLEPDRIVLDRLASTPLQDPSGTPEQNPAWLTLRPENMNSNEVVLSSLELLVLPYAGAFRLKEVKEIHYSILLHTSSYAGQIDRRALLLGEDLSHKAVSSPAPLPLAVRLEGRFPTAFPDGPPVSGEEAAPIKSRAVLSPFLKKSRGRSRVVLVADADLIADRYSVQKTEVAGQMIQRPVNDNLNLAMNLIGQMTGSELLLGLRSRGTYERPFLRIRQLELKARDRWNAEEDKLFRRLEQIQRQIATLQVAKDPARQVVFTPEQKKEIEQFQSEKYETQQQLREVRRKLRRDIERLGWVLKGINLIFFPAGVALCGVIHGLRRRRTGRGRTPSPNACRAESGT